MIRLALAFIAICLASTAMAQARKPSHCIAMVQDVPGIEFVHKAAYTDPVAADTVRLHYIDHAMFLLQTPGGLSVVTDYVGFIGPVDFVPSIVTMNRAHGSHYTANPDPRIPHVLPGWNPTGGPANHRLELEEMLVRSISTDIRSSFDGGVLTDGNSIFVFEVAGLCIGHLGHLHHEPTAEQYAAIGRLDIVMAPVDGGMTVPLPTMIKILKRLRSSVVIPMHWFSEDSLNYFIAGMSDDFAVERNGASTLEMSLRTLPRQPTIYVLWPAYLRDSD